MFGKDLTERAYIEKRDVPFIVSSCIDYIEATSLDFEGLYRKNGGAGSMKTLIEAFENARPEEIDLIKFDDVCAITSVMKQYLRKLPVPLITFDVYESFVQTSAIPDISVRIRATRDIFESLPPTHLATLRVLCKHLKLVAEYQTQNLMSPRNLAVVLGPTILWDESGAREMTDMHSKNSGIQFIIEHADKVF